MKLCPWTILGRNSRPGRPQDAPPSVGGTPPLEPFWPKLAPQWSHLDPAWDQNRSENRIFEDSLPVLASQNRLWERVLKKHENNIFCHVNYDTLMLLNTRKTL